MDTNDQPATRADIKALKTEIKTSARADLQALEKRMFKDLAAKSELQTVKQDVKGLKQDVGSLKQDVKRLDDKIDRVAAGLVNTQAELREMKETMATKADTERILSAIDAFAGKAQGYDRVSALHGQSLTDVQVAVKDHERRISSLEAASR